MRPHRIGQEQVNIANLPARIGRHADGSEAAT